MSIMMLSLIGIMDIGNKQAIIWCEPDGRQMFPFAREEGNCMLPAGTESLLKRNIRLLKEIGIEDITVIGNRTPAMKAEIKDLNCQLAAIEQNDFSQIREQIKGDCIIMSGGCYCHKNDLRRLVSAAANQVLTRPWLEQESAFGAACGENGKIKMIFAHPRDHYVSLRVFPIFQLQPDWAEEIELVGKGALTVNCGQMPDERLHLENILSCLLDRGLELYPVLCQAKIIEARFAWDLLEIGRDVCGALPEWSENKIGENSEVTNVQQKKGHLRIGSGCRIKNVIFEGKCQIGNNVVLEDGAVIGENCIIADGTVIRHACYIHDHTVIGQNNKIDFGAEISGITMEGVCAVHGCEVYGVIGRFVDIAAGVVMAILRFDDTQVRRYVDGKAYASSYTNCICIGDYVRTGVHSTYLPGVSIGSRSAIGPGVLVETDVPPNSLVLIKQTTIVKEWKSEKYGW